MCISSFAKMSRTPDRQPRDACSSHVGLSVGWSVGAKVLVGAADGVAVVGAAVVGAGEVVGAADGAAVEGAAVEGAAVEGAGVVGATVGSCAAARPRATRASRRRRILSSAASMASRVDGVTGEELREAGLGFKTGELVGRAYDETLRGQPFRPWRRLRGSLSARRDASIDRMTGFSRGPRG